MRLPDACVVGTFAQRVAMVDGKVNRKRGDAVKAPSKAKDRDSSRIVGDVPVGRGAPPTMGRPVDNGALRRQWGADSSTAALLSIGASRVGAGGGADPAWDPTCCSGALLTPAHCSL